MSEITSGLVGRIEAASGPDRKLDAEIDWNHRNVVGKHYSTQRVEGGQLHPVSGWWCDEFLLSHKAPEYTASIDAAMTLVPEGCVWSVMTDYELPGRARVWDADKLVNHQADGATPALALCAAAIRARAPLPAPPAKDLT